MTSSMLYPSSIQQPFSIHRFPSIRVPSSSISQKHSSTSNSHPGIPSKSTSPLTFTDTCRHGKPPRRRGRLRREGVWVGGEGGDWALDHGRDTGPAGLGFLHGFSGGHFKGKVGKLCRSALKSKRCGLNCWVQGCISSRAPTCSNHLRFEDGWGGCGGGSNHRT